MSVILQIFLISIKSDSFSAPQHSFSAPRYLIPWPWMRSADIWGGGGGGGGGGNVIMRITHYENGNITTTFSALSLLNCVYSINLIMKKKC